jgi:HAE1 family hydrophobic/amphiphilic exporter-1
MKLSELCVRRPVFATMLSVVLLVLGGVSFFRLGVDLRPNVDIPVVTVTTNLKGASPEEIETGVTRPIEEVVNTISGIDELRSVSREGVSTVTVRFLLERKSEEAAQDVRDKIATVVKRLPDGTDPPVVVKFDLDAAPVMTYAVTAKRDPKELTRIADEWIKQRIESVDGVGAISIVGGRKRAVNLFVDPARLEAFSLTVPQLKGALEAQNLEIPGGRVDSGTREMVLRTMGRMATVADFGNLIVANVSGRPVFLKDVARVEDGEEEPRSLARLDGVPSVNLVVQKQSGTNTIEVIRAVQAKVDTLRRILPPDVDVVPIRNQGTFILRSIHEVEFHLLLGALLTSLVVLAFMGDVRTTLIASVAIPTSIVGTFAAMRYLDFTLNNMTLLGLTLAVGIVIDDAIVVLENIFRHVEEKGEEPRSAAVKGTAEIGLAVSATTLSLVVIFLPVAFMSGQVGRMFRSYGITVAVAILISWFVSFTLTPMLSSRFLKAKHGKGGRGGEGGGDDGSGDDGRKGFYGRVVLGSYLRLLRLSLKRRWIVVGAAAVVIASLYPLAGAIGKDFMPDDDQGEFEVWIRTPEGYTLSAVDGVFREVEAELRGLRGVTNLLTQIGGVAEGDVTQGTIYVRLSDLGKRDFSQFDVMRDARRLLKKYPTLNVSVQNIGGLGGGGHRSSMMNFAVTGPDLGKLSEYGERITTALSGTKGFVDVDTTLSSRKPELRVEVDRKKAADLGVQIAHVASSLNVFVGGETVGKFKEGADQYDVWLRADLPYRGSAPAVENLPIPSSRAGKVRVRDVASLSRAMGPSQIDRTQRQRQLTVLANLDGTLPLGAATEKAKEVVKSLGMPPQYEVRFYGRSKTLNETLSNFMMALLLSVVFMYIVLAAQFESFLHPITIMLALPISIPFALLSLLFLGETLNIYSIMGLFVLFGIVKKNGILQVDYTNTLRAEGLGRDEAILEANAARLRPILMTTVTLIAAMVPIALGKGPGAASRASMAKVIIGGQALCLLLTLLLTPVAYSLFDDLGRSERVRRLFGRLADGWPFRGGVRGAAGRAGGATGTGADGAAGAAKGAGRE